ncbi:MAG TPA: choice-of-anchor tandem repeat GloVer-containing protein [Rhizomicrobium sp.]
MVGLLDTGRRLLACCWALTAVVPIVTADAAPARPETVLYSFLNNGADGNAPDGNVINVHGTLYGTTVSGGASEVGTVFSINLSTGAESVLYSLKNNGGDGKFPYAGLINVDGTLYDTTSRGGSSVSGTVFSINPSTGAETVLYSFQNNGEDGNFPMAGLTNVHGTLYGTTVFGGTSGGGTVFSINPSTGAEAVLHSFQYNGADGNGPQAGLTKVNGILYGTTSSGGDLGNGTVFSINPFTGAYSVLYSFGTAPDGNDPLGNLINVDGTLYGTTFAGGTGFNCRASQSGCGTVFSLDLSTNKESVIYSFQNNGADGNNPIAGAINVNGTLYGTTEVGGASNVGTVFSINLSTGAESVLHAFRNNGADGTYPVAGLIDFHSTLYGTTSGGGAQNEGTVFKIKP